MGVGAMELHDFLQLEHPEQYDFMREIIDFSPGADELERFMVYQAVGIRETVKKEELADLEDYRAAAALADRCSVRVIKGEADQCALTSSIVRRLWDEEILALCTKRDLTSLSGDTMNAPFSTLRQRLNMRSKRIMVRAYYEEPQKIEGFYKEARKFLQFSYSIGNFIPEPSDFNCYRPQKTKDYWDLTLNGVWRWYTGSEHLRSIISGSDGVIERCRQWLERFGAGGDGWDSFVEQNYMQDFVRGGPDGRPYGPPKELWQGHFGGSLLPDSEAALSQFFSNAADWIEARGVRIVRALKESHAL